MIKVIEAASFVSGSAAKTRAAHSKNTWNVIKKHDALVNPTKICTYKSIYVFWDNINGMLYILGAKLLCMILFI